MLWHFRTKEWKEKKRVVVISCFTCVAMRSWAKKFMNINAPLGLYNLQCSTCCGISELKKGKEISEWLLYLVILAPVCVAGPDNL